MSGKQQTPQVQPKPKEQPAAAPAGPSVDNSFMLEKLKAQGDAPKVGDDFTSIGSGYSAQTSELPSLGKVTHAGSADHDRQEGTSIGHKDPKGKHLVTTSETVRRTSESTPRFIVDENGKKRLAGRNPGSSERTTTSGSAGLSGSDFTAGASRRVEEFTGVNSAGDKDASVRAARETQGGITLNGKDGLAGNVGHSTEKTTTVQNADGTTSEKTRTTGANLQVNSKATALTGTVGDGTNTVGLTANVSHDFDEAGATLSYQRQTGKKSGFAGSLGFQMNFDTAEQARVEGKDGYGNALDVMNTPTPANPNPAPQDHLYTNKRDFGWGVNAGLGVQAGVVGVSASGYYSKSNNVSFNLSGDTKVGDAPDSPTLDELWKKDEKAAKAFVAQHDNMVHRDGKTLQTVGELPIAQMKPGQSYTLEQSTAFGGGAGISVYGIGGSGSYDRAQVQKTNIVRDDQGGVTIDIEVADQQKAEGNLDAPGLQIGGGAHWGNSSQVRFRFDTTTDAGKAKLAEFQKTGVLPGAMDAEDPSHKRYTELAGKKDLSKQERAELAEIADRVNAGAMEKLGSLQRGEQPYKADGVEYEFGRQGKHDAVKGHVKGLGFTLGEFGSRDAMGTHWYKDREGNLQYGSSARHDDFNFWSRDEYAAAALNDKSAVDTHLSAETNDTEVGKKLIRLSGDRVPTDIQSGIFGSQTGNGYDDYTKFEFTTYDGDSQRFGAAMQNVDLSNLTQPYRTRVEREQQHQAQLDAPIPEGRLADQILDNQALDDASKWVGAYRSGDPELLAQIPPDVRELIDGNQSALVENAKADYARFEQFEKQRRLDPFGANPFAMPSQGLFPNAGFGDRTNPFQLGNGVVNGDRLGGLQSIPQLQIPQSRPQLTLPGSQTKTPDLPAIPTIGADGQITFADPFEAMMDVRSNDGAAQTMQKMLQGQLADKARLARMGQTDGQYIEGQQLDDVSRASAMIRDQQMRQLKANMAGPMAHQAAKIMMGSDFTSAPGDLMAAMARQATGDDQLMLSLPLSGKHMTERADIIRSHVMDRDGKADMGRMVRFMEAMNRVGDRKGMDPSYDALLHSRAKGEYK
ncbi:MAG: hypothetical protein R3F61_14270 [Myxococcota bacterium]